MSRFYTLGISEESDGRLEISFRDGIVLIRKNRDAPLVIDGEFINTRIEEEKLYIFYRDSNGHISKISPEEILKNYVPKSKEADGQIWLNRNLILDGHIDKAEKSELERTFLELCKEREAIWTIIELMEQILFDYQANENRKIIKKYFSNSGNVKKRKWTASKGEFAYFIKSKYIEDQKNTGTTKRRFIDLHDATRQIFQLYTFPDSWKWTVGACYSYVKKA